MVAYSFKARFAAPILAGTKTQTIRADRRRHARPGEELQLYTGMRTKQCKLIRVARCVSVSDVRLRFGDDAMVAEKAGSSWGDAHYVARSPKHLDAFAMDDGFTNWADMRAFWAKEHPGTEEFEGVLIRWAP